MGIGSAATVVAAILRAKTLAFLLGPDARYVNGHDLVVDGGITGNFLGRLPGISQITKS